MRTEREELYDTSEGANMRSPEQAAYNRSLPYKEFLRSEYWRHVRRFKTRRAGCAFCGTRRKRLDIHHKTYEHRGDELNHLGDLIVLCGDCHKNRHISGELRGPLCEILGVELFEELMARGE